MGLDTGLSEQQKTIVFASWFGWALDGYDLPLYVHVLLLLNRHVLNDALSNFYHYFQSQVLEPNRWEVVKGTVLDMGGTFRSNIKN